MTRKDGVAVVTLQERTESLFELMGGSARELAPQDSRKITSLHPHKYLRKAQPEIQRCTEENRSSHSVLC